MIILTKLDNHKVLVSLETVKYMEAVPDTLLFFINGESLMVKESLEEVEQAIITHQGRVLQSASL